MRQILCFFLIFFAKHDEFTPFLFKFAPKYVYRFQTNGCIFLSRMVNGEFVFYITFRDFLCWV